MRSASGGGKRSSVNPCSSKTGSWGAPLFALSSTIWKNAAGEEAPVDRQHLAAHEAGRLRGEEHRRPGQLLDPAPPLHRGAEEQLAAPVGAVQELLVQLGAEDAGGDGVHAHAVGGPFHGQGAGQAGHARLAGRVGRDLVQAHEGGERADVDDPPVAPLDHGAAEDLAGAEGAGEVGLQDVVPLLLGHLEAGHPPRLARAVDEDVDRAEGGDARGQQALERRAVGHVARLPQRAPAARLDLRGHFVDQLPPPPGGDDVRPRLGQAQGQRAADAGSPADDDRRASC